MVEGFEPTYSFARPSVDPTRGRWWNPYPQYLLDTEIDAKINARVAKRYGSLVHFQEGRIVDGGYGVNLKQKYVLDGIARNDYVGALSPQYAVDTGVRDLGGGLFFQRIGFQVEVWGNVSGTTPIVVSDSAGFRPESNRELGGSAGAVAVPAEGLTITHGAGSIYGTWLTRDIVTEITTLPGSPVVTA